MLRYHTLSKSWHCNHDNHHDDDDGDDADDDDDGDDDYGQGDAGEYECKGEASGRHVSITTQVSSATASYHPLIINFPHFESKKQASIITQVNRATSSHTAPQ